MRVRAKVVLVLALPGILASGCPSASGACTRNSDCAAGSYCSARACVTDCTPATVAADCDPGEACSSFGMCVGGEDAGPPDAGGATDAGGAPTDTGGATDVGPGVPDGGADAPDLRPACVIAGGADGDGDGYCIGVPVNPDCDDADAAVSPVADEICTPSTTGSVSADENCDGAIDEACGWFFGRPHPVMGVVQPAAAGYPGTFGSFLDEAGTRLFVAQSGGAALAGTFVVSRADRSTPFSGITRLPFADSAFRSYEVVMEPGELRGIAQGSLASAPPGALFAIERTSTAMPFAVRHLDAFADAGGHPTISRNGLELFYIGAGAVHRATRATRSVDFTAPTTVASVPGDANGLSLSDDGHDLFFYRGTPLRIFRAHRADVSTATFATAVEVTELDPTGIEELAFPHVSLRTREFFFTSATLGYGPMAARSLWRVQICRDGPCVEAPIACPTGGIRSTDLFHCYREVGAPAAYSAARSTCEAMSARVVEIHSAAEHMLVWDRFGGATSVWLGLEEGAVTDQFAWRSGAPLAYANWNPGEPNPGAGEPAAAIYAPLGGVWVDIAATPTFTVVCETEVWPTW